MNIFAFIETYNSFLFSVQINDFSIDSDKADADAGCRFIMTKH